ncbi:MAG: hypothetical protein FJW96_07635 [Actinobacteria bacterium]|nr:hypothetical protein [Actinomycetota bacterium]
MRGRSSLAERRDRRRRSDRRRRDQLAAAARTLGVRAFGVNAYTADAGEHVVEPHTEQSLQHEEIYVVLAGSARFTLEGETLDAAAGTVVFVSDPSVRREARALENGTTVLAVGGKAGEAYSPSAWEAYFAVERHRATGDHAAAIAELEEAATAHPDHSGVVYALACWHALAGNEERALAHLRRSIELEPRYAEWAATDEDLASVHDQL